MSHEQIVAVKVQLTPKYFFGYLKSLRDFWHNCENGIKFAQNVRVLRQLKVGKKRYFSVRVR